jgi:chromosomal replication initiation ATPase DnaA
MPTVHDIVKEALDLALKDLKIEALVQESVWIKMKSKTKYSNYYQRRVTITSPEEAAAKRLARFNASQKTKTNLRKFTELEQSILSIVCRVHKIKVEDFLKVRRGRELVDARFQFAAVLRLQFYYTFTKIAFLLGKDHSSIIHSIKQHKDFYDTISSYKALYIRVLNEIEKDYPGLLNTALNPNIILVESRTGYGKREKVICSTAEQLENEQAN